MNWTEVHDIKIAYCISGLCRAGWATAIIPSVLQGLCQTLGAVNHSGFFTALVRILLILDTRISPCWPTKHPRRACPPTSPQVTPNSMLAQVGKPCELLSAAAAQKIEPSVSVDQFKSFQLDPGVVLSSCCQLFLNKVSFSDWNLKLGLKLHL